MFWGECGTVLVLFTVGIVHETNLSAKVRTVFDLVRLKDARPDQLMAESPEEKLELDLESEVLIFHWTSRPGGT